MERIRMYMNYHVFEQVMFHDDVATPKERGNSETDKKIT